MRVVAGQINYQETQVISSIRSENTKLREDEGFSQARKSKAEGESRFRVGAEWRFSGTTAWVAGWKRGQRG